MSQIQSLENHGLNNNVFNPTIEPVNSKTSELEIILYRLYHRENEIFKRIVIAIRMNDSAQSMMLASELLRIRILKRNLGLSLELSYRYNSKHSL